MSDAELWLDDLILNDPDEYERLLHSYFLLLGERRLWWQRCAQSDDPRWASCVRATIVQIARRSKCEPAWLADLLDDGAFPLTKRLIMRIAKETLSARKAA